MEKVLPKGWVETEFGAINQRSVTKNIDPSNFPEERFELYSVPVFETGQPEFQLGEGIKSSKQLVKRGDVLVCKINPRINRVWVVDDYSPFRKIASSEWIVIGNELINSLFLKYQFQSKQFRALLQSEVSGVGGSLTRARPKLVNAYPIFLPPLAEQERIVAKLDKLFAQHEKIKAALERIPQLLKTFRQQVLSQAVTGKLTEQWREGKQFHSLSYSILESLQKEIRAKHNKKYKPLAKVLIGENTKGIKELYKIPNSWLWVNVGQVTWNISDGPHYSPNYVDKSIGKRFISMRNISDVGVDFSDCKYVSQEDHEEFIKRGKPETGDILYTKGGSTGIACRVGDDIDFSYWVHVALLKPVKKVIDSSYLKNCLNGDLCFRQSQAFTHGVGNQDLGLTRMIFIALPLPPIQEQQEIVRRVESLFAKADAIEARYHALKAKVESLPQAILHKAFKGELVPQLPTDGDAKVLLTEIVELKKGVKGGGKNEK